MDVETNGDVENTSDVTDAQMNEAMVYKSKGNEYFKAQNYRLAVIEYSRALNIIPQNVDFLNNRAAAYLMLGNHTIECIDDCKQVLKIDEKNSKAFSRLLKAYLKRGQFDDIFNLSEKYKNLMQSPENKVVVDDAKKNDARLKRVKEILKSNKESEMSFALSLVNAGIRVSDESVEFIVLKIELLLMPHVASSDMNRYQEAYQLSTSLLQAGDKEMVSNSKFLLLRAKCFYFLENFDQCIKHLQQGLYADPDNQQLAIMLKNVKKLVRFKEDGNTAFKNYEYRQAIDNYTAALELETLNSPKFRAKLYSNRGLCFNKLGKNQEALKDLNLAIENDKEYASAYLKRAKVLMEVGGKDNLNQAMYSYEEAERIMGESTREIQQGKRDVKLELKKASRKDYYKILELSQRENATEADIKKAYRKQALVWHPDRHSTETDEEKKQAEVNFKDVGEAYSILSDPQKKQKYDQGYNYEEIEQGGEGGGGGFHGMSQEDLMRMFAAQMGGGGGRGGFNFAGFG